MCKNPECGSRFYDLNRDPITCPICNTVYQIRVQPVSVAPARLALDQLKKWVPVVRDEGEPDLTRRRSEEVVALEGEEEVAAESRRGYSGARGGVL